MKELKRPKITDYGNAYDSDDYSLALHKYCDKLESERDDLFEEGVNCGYELQTLKDAVRKLVKEFEFDLTDILSYWKVDYIRDINNVHSRTVAETKQEIIGKLKELIK